MATPLGAHNARITAARRLLLKKARDEQRRFTFEGDTLLDEALRAHVQIEEIFCTQEALERQRAVADAERSGIPVFVVDDAVIRRLSDARTPSGVVSVAMRELRDAPFLLEGDGPIAILAGISDPGNAGTLLRTAEAFGFRAVLFTAGSVEPHHPKVVRSAMGSLFRVPVGLFDPIKPPHQLQAWDVIGLDARGEPIDTLTWRRRTAVAVGSERHGLGPARALCARLAAIPMDGAAESLNAAVAGAVAFYEASKALRSLA